jgi:hypothetical protein
MMLLLSFSASTYRVIVVSHAQLPGPASAEGVGGVKVDNALASVCCGNGSQQAQLQQHNRPAQKITTALHVGDQKR